MNSSCLGLRVGPASSPPKHRARLKRQLPSCVLLSWSFSCSGSSCCSFVPSVSVLKLSWICPSSFCRWPAGHGRMKIVVRTQHKTQPTTDGIINIRRQGRPCFDTAGLRSCPSIENQKDHQIIIALVFSLSPSSRTYRFRNSHDIPAEYSPGQGRPHR